VRF
ncbi:hypothetical protein D021_0311, partial [Vibrio parahaemolyticus 10296]|jgi:RNA:NAD 2'-phosphotransferase (TPT1/KptA family)